MVVHVQLVEPGLYAAIQGIAGLYALLANCNRVNAFITPIIDLSDPGLFGNDAAEDETPELLSSYFVEKAEFRRFYSVNTPLAIVRARKGIGKSALLAHVAHQVRTGDRKTVVVQVKGSDLTGMGEFLSSDPSVLVNQWQQVICSQINVEIGRRVGFAFTDTSMALVESAELAGFRSRNLVGALIERLKVKAKFDHAEVDIVKPPAGKPSYLLDNFARENKGVNVWVVVDDIDATFTNSDQMRVKAATFFSACRKLVSDVQGVRIRAAVRTDVWTEIRRTDEALDKCEQYIVDLAWDRDEISTIILMRVLSYLRRLQPDNPRFQRWTLGRQSSKISDLIFPAMVKWGEFVIPTPHAISRLAVNRPRWATQLCRLSGSHAHRLGTKIDMNSIWEALPRFGQLRLDDLYREHGHQFAHLQSLIECFADGYRRYTTAELTRWITKRMRIDTSHLSDDPGLQLNGNRISRVLELCHFLYKIGFIYGVKQQSDELGHYTYYEDRPELLQNPSNVDDGLIWEIDASYRKVLRIKRDYHPNHDRKSKSTATLDPNQP